MSAYTELMEFLKDGEVVEAIVFGGWGGCGWDEEDDGPQPVPAAQQGKVLTLEQAQPMMTGWRFHGGYGGADTYAVYIWTNQRVIWVTQYDGSTTLSSAPRNPVPCDPEMPGG